jgi:hypothetical protein
MEQIGACGCQSCCGVNEEGHDYFGLCPYCGKTDGCHSVGRDHWYVCHEHKTKWLIGSNLFSTWRDLTEDERRRNRRIFDEYRTDRARPARVTLGKARFDDPIPF